MLRKFTHKKKKKTLDLIHTSSGSWSFPPLLELLFSSSEDRRSSSATGSRSGIVFPNSLIAGSFPSDIQSDYKVREREREWNPVGLGIRSREQGECLALGGLVWFRRRNLEMGFSSLFLITSNSSSSSKGGCATSAGKTNSQPQEVFVASELPIFLSTFLILAFKKSERIPFSESSPQFQFLGYPPPHPRSTFQKVD